MAERPLRADPGDRAVNSPSAHAPPRGTRRGGGPPWRPGRGLTLVVLLALWGAILGGGALAYFAFTLPDTSHLTVAARRPSVTILAGDGSTIASYGDLFGRALTVGEMSPYLPKAVIATEDRRFYYHFGIDPFGLARAALADLRAGHIVEGGSTITQQLAKILFLTPERSFSRKIRETLLALWLERRFTKNEILAIYLNRVYLGDGTYGVDAAARRYFGRSATQIDLYQSATIAGLLAAPTRFDPLRHPNAAAARTRQVLDNMVEAGYIAPGVAAAAERQGGAPVKVAPPPQDERYFADWVTAQLPDFAGTADHDLVVRTTFDPAFQALADRAVRGILVRYGARDRVSQGALVAMSPDGAIRAMVGGRNYNDSQFNRTTQAQRQPGSSFKPFVYLAGLEAGLRPGDHFYDEPIRIGNWEPHDYGNRYRGDVTMAEGLADSLNAVAVQVAQRAGIKHVIAVANRLGITSDLTPDASLALGTDDVNLLELVSAYAPFANGGMGVLPYGISEIDDTAGKVLYRREGSGPGRVIAPDLVGEMNDMLSGVIAHGTGRGAALPRPAAGKTGTTQDYRDAWFIGYTADLVSGVWFGNDDNAPMRGVVGGSLPARAWHDFMLAATRGMPVRPLPGAAYPAIATAAAEGMPMLRPPPPAMPRQADGNPLDQLFRYLGLDGGQPVALPRPAPVYNGYGYYQSPPPGYWQR